jgi:hypothetical protein
MDNVQSFDSYKHRGNLHIFTIFLVNILSFFSIDTMALFGKNLEMVFKTVVCAVS